MSVLLTGSSLACDTDYNWCIMSVLTHGRHSGAYIYLTALSGGLLSVQDRTLTIAVLYSCNTRFDAQHTPQLRLDATLEHRTA